MINDKPGTAILLKKLAGVCNDRLQTINYFYTMEPYRPVPRAAFEALEEAYLLRQPLILTFEQEGARKTVLHVLITDLHQERDGEYLTLEGGLHLRLDQLVAINGKPVHFWA